MRIYPAPHNWLDSVVMAWRERCFLLVLTVSVVSRGTAAQDCPQLGLNDSAFLEAAAQETPVPVLYLYTTPLGPQCSGSISEVEFCFRPVEMAATERLFTLVTLIPMGNAFRVVTRSNVTTAPTDVDTCNEFGAITRCCGTRRLEPAVEITQDSVYGIETTEARLLTFRDITRPGRALSLAPGISFDVNATINATVPDPSASEILVAMVRFIDIEHEVTTSIPLAVTPQSSLLAQPNTSPSPSGLPDMNTGQTSNPPAVSTAPREPTSTHTPPQPSTGPPAEQSGDQALIPIGIGVALGAVVVLIVVIAVVVVGVMVVQRRRRREVAYDVKQSQSNGITNAIYTGDASLTVGAATDYHDIIELNTKDPELPYEYAMPDEIRGGKTVDAASHNEYSYATPEATPEARGTKVASHNEYSYATPEATPEARETQAASLNEYSYATTEARGAKLTSSLKKSIYEVPAKDENSLYAQFEKIKVRTIQRNTVKTATYLGSGQFGTVSRGEWESPDGTLEVAIKTLKTDAAQTDRVKFLQEAAIMGQFKHNNVVKLYGVVRSGEPVMIVLELLAKGDLRKHLLSLVPEPGKKVEDLEHTLLSYCRQIGFGMDYLSRKAFVYRDLAARNILVAGDETCKVADFGMARDLEDENYYISSGGKIPVKWTAPEAIHFKKYSSASDVWSYGAMMYEIWSMGRKPFTSYTNSQAIQFIDAGHRLPPPPGCPKAVYELMIKTWHQKASERPDFTAIVQWLSRPDPQLLRWSEEDRAVHPRASLLGAELEAAAELYRELQDTYVVDSEDYA